VVVVRVSGEDIQSLTRRAGSLTSNSMSTNWQAGETFVSTDAHAWTVFGCQIVRYEFTTLFDRTYSLSRNMQENAG